MPDQAAKPRDDGEDVSAAPLFERVAIIGCGLIGSSLARAIAARGLACTVVGHDADADVRVRSRALKFADAIAETAAEAADAADLVVLAIPVRASGPAIAEIAEHLCAGSIVTDVGSVKVSVAEAVNKALPDGVTFVPGHPIAGAEYSGPENGFASLFQDRWCILTPDDDTPQWALDRVTALWRGVGSEVTNMSAEHHDLVLAITSHVPHLIAYNIVGTAADLEEVTQSEVIKFSAGGFRDFTRIAASDPVMWRDIFLTNREAVLEMLGRFSEDLSSLQRAIRWGDGDALEALFTRTRAIRRGIIDAGQDAAAPDFGRRQGDGSLGPVQPPYAPGGDATWGGDER